MKTKKSIFKRLQHNPIVCVIILLLTFVLYYYQLPVTDDKFTVRVISVIDGDTVDVLFDNHRQRIRLAYIDAPEIGQPYGQRSKQTLIALVKNKMVNIRPLNQDNYQRTVAIIEVDSMNINREMVRLGMAWVYTHYNDDLLLLPLEAKAKVNKTGLWQQKNPIAPWIYRQSKK